MGGGGSTRGLGGGGSGVSWGGGGNWRPRTRGVAPPPPGLHSRSHILGGAIGVSPPAPAHKHRNRLRMYRLQNCSFWGNWGFFNLRTTNKPALGRPSGASQNRARIRSDHWPGRTLQSPKESNPSHSGRLHRPEHIGGPEWTRSESVDRRR